MAATADHPRNLGTGVSSVGWRPTWRGTAAGTGSGGSVDLAWTASPSTRGDRRPAARHRLRPVVRASRRPGDLVARARYRRPRLRLWPAAGARVRVLRHRLRRQARRGTTSPAGEQHGRGDRWRPCAVAAMGRGPPPVGIGDIAAAACRDASGCWGWILEASSRCIRAGRSPTTTSTCSPPWVPRRWRYAAAVHRRRSREDLGSSDPPGVLVLDRDLSPISRTEAATRWIAALPLSELFARLGHAAGGHLPGGHPGPRR